MGFTEPEVILAMAETIMKADQERDEALAEVERLRELVKVNFDLYHEAMEAWRAAAAERDELRVRIELGGLS